MKYNPVFRTLYDFTDSAVDAFSMHTGFFKDVTRITPSTDCFIAFYDLSNKYKNFFTPEELNLFEMIACLPLSGSMISIINNDVSFIELSGEEVVKYCSSCFKKLVNSLEDIVARYKNSASDELQFNLVKTIFLVKDKFCNNGSFYNNMTKKCDSKPLSNSSVKKWNKFLKE